MKHSKINSLGKMVKIWEFPRNNNINSTAFKRSYPIGINQLEMEGVIVEDEDEVEQIDRHIESFVYSSQEFMNRF